MYLFVKDGTSDNRPIHAKNIVNFGVSLPSHNIIRVQLLEYKIRRSNLPME